MSNEQNRFLDYEPTMEELVIARRRSRELIASSRKNVEELEVQFANCRRLLSRSRELVQRAGSGPRWMLGDALPPAAAIEHPVDESRAEVRTFAAVTELIERIEQSAVRDMDLIGELILTIKRAIAGKGDSLLLIGVLLEGIVQIVLQQPTTDERRETVVALCALLADRTNQNSL